MQGSCTLYFMFGGDPSTNWQKGSIGQWVYHSTCAVLPSVSPTVSSEDWSLVFSVLSQADEWHWLLNGVVKGWVDHVNSDSLRENKVVKRIIIIRRVCVFGPTSPVKYANNSFLKVVHCSSTTGRISGRKIPHLLLIYLLLVSLIYRNNQSL